MPPRPKYDPYRWTSTAFASELAKKTRSRSDVRYCFVLGAGASVQSGIPSAKTLAQSFVRELYGRQDAPSETVEVWAEKNLGIEGFKWDSADLHYTELYEQRYGDNPEDGFARIEQEIEKAEPSLGYSILAQLLASTGHNVVVTTNFDNLVADAMAVFTDRLPLVCGHESLAMFARPLHRRPIIAKVHRDVMFSPISTRRGTSHLSTQWTQALDALFQNYTPVFIGYGGNDGSLMNYLNHLEPKTFREQPIWCVYTGRSDKRELSAQVGEEVREFMAEHRGVYVPILGFDELMVEIAHAMKTELERSSVEPGPIAAFDPKRFALDKDVDVLKFAEDRAERYRKRVAELASSLGDTNSQAETKELRQAYQSVAAAVVSDAESHYLKALAEVDLAKRRQLLEQGTSQYPEHSGIKKALEDLRMTEGDQEVFAKDRERAFLNEDASKLEVLWVDDRPDNNKSLVDHLTQLGHSVTSAKSTSEAQEKLIDESFDVIVSDMARPKEERAGINLARWVRAKYPTIPIHIYCGGWAARNLRWEALEAGVTTITSSPSQLLKSIIETKESEKK